MSEPKYLGLIRWCERGRLLYDTWNDIIHDKTRPPFDEAYEDAYNAWKEHRDSCPECGYV